ncbi:hypothetical protein PJI16_16930 [Nitrospira sp. MA-1]|nr:hypothetical protein [Nitrospira sp. MA-1]
MEQDSAFTICLNAILVADLGNALAPVLFPKFLRQLAGLLLDYLQQWNRIDREASAELPPYTLFLPCANTALLITLPFNRCTGL